VEKSAQHERPLRLLGLRPAGSYAPSALRPRFALPPGIPRGYAPRPSASPRYRGPQRGPNSAPGHGTAAQTKNRPHWYTTAVRSLRKGQASTRALNKPPRYATLSHPPRPFPLGRGASRPLSSGEQAARRFACFSCPLPVSVGAFQGRQGFASPSGVARVLAFGCGPRQPPLRPLTPFPLKNPKPRRARWRSKSPARDV